MASITLDDVPEDLHARLRQEAEANFRSLDQEALSRLQRSLEHDPTLNTARDQQWIDEAIASGPESPLTLAEMDAIRDSILRNGKRD